MGLFRAAQQFERPLVDGAFADLAVEARDRFGVVIKDVGLGGQNDTERIPVAAKIPRSFSTISWRELVWRWI